MNILQKMTGMTLRGKLIAALLASCLVPIIMVSTTYLWKASQSIEDQAYRQLESIRDSKKSEIESYFSQISSQVTTFSENHMIVEAMKDFNNSFYRLSAERDLSASELSGYRESIAGFYRNEFGAKYQAENQKSIDTNSILPTTAEATILQYDYISNNANPLGSKDGLDSVNDGSLYSEHHANYHPTIRNYLNHFGYYDIFLVNPESGDIVYSVFKEVDYATSLKSGPYSRTNFAEAFNRALALGPGESVALEDFKPYSPSYDAPASFIASPIYDGKTLEGILIFQMPVGRINEIMGQSSGLGETGETYLVGADNSLRSQSRFEDASTILAAEIGDNTLTSGESGIGTFANRYQIDALTSYGPVEIEGLSWTIVAEMSKSEALAALGSLIWSTLTAAIVGISFSVILAFGLARVVMRQLGADPIVLKDVARTITDDTKTFDFGDASQLTGVYHSMSDMQDKIKSAQERDRAMLAENGRISQALNNASSNVLIADTEMNVVYMNDAANALFSGWESDLRRDLPTFEARNVVGSNIDVFHKNPAHQRNMLEQLNNEYETQIEVGGRIMQLVVNPMVSDTGERLGSVLEWRDRTQEARIESEVQTVVDRALQGDLGSRISLEGKAGFFGSLSASMNQLVEIAEQIVGDTSRVIGAMSNGNLTETIDRNYEGSFLRLKEDVNSTIAKLTDVVGNIQTASVSVKTGAGEISHGNTDLSQRTEEQAGSLEETSSSMKQMTSTVRQNAENASEANELAQSTRVQAEKGGAVVNEAVRAMEEINDSSKRIADIIGVIDEIAFQTNLLALNASVEAARAGEQGRGFAVVASEVRNLAGRSATAAKEIKDLIEDSGKKVEDGSRLVNDSGQTLEQIVASVKQVTDIVGEIAAASLEQSTGIDEVNKAVSHMDELTQQNAALVEQAAAASESLGSQADDLYSMVDFFTIDRNSVASGSVARESSSAAQERRRQDRPWVDSKPKFDAPGIQSKRVVGADDQEWEEF